MALLGTFSLSGLRGEPEAPVLPPAPAINPSPANAGIDIVTDGILSWGNGGGATSYNVRFGTANPPPLIGNQAGTTYDPGELLPNTLYRWRIDSVNAGGTTIGTVWSFTTEVPNNVAVSGTVLTRTGAAVSGLTIAFTGTGASAGEDRAVVTNGSGLYSADDLPSGWSGTIATTDDVSMTPASRSLSNVIVDTFAQSFVKGTNWYASPTGSNVSPNDGTRAKPWLTAQKAVDSSFAGDTVRLRGASGGGPATYKSGSGSASVPVINFLITRQGSPGLPIYVMSEPGEEVILDGRDGAGTIITTALIQIKSRYIEVTGPIKCIQARRHAVYVLSTAVGDSDNVNVRLIEGDTVSTFAASLGAFLIFGPCRNVVFEDCHSHHNSIGFEMREDPIQSSDTAFTPPKAGNTGYAADLPPDQWDAWPGWVDIAPRYCTFRRCLSHDNVQSPGNSDGYALRYAVECVIEDCIGYSNNDDIIDLLGATRCIVRRSIGFNPGVGGGNGNGCKIGARGGLDHLLHHNIFFNCPADGIDTADSMRAQLYNNTCFNNGGYGIFVDADGQRIATAQFGHIILNNICKRNFPDGLGGFQNMGQHDWAVIAIADRNCVAGGWAHPSAIPQGANSIAVDPQFANDALVGGQLVINTTFPDGLTIPQKMAFIRDQVAAKLRLLTTSPCKNTGVVIPGITDEDAIGAAPVGVPDMGALEAV